MSSRIATSASADRGANTTTGRGATRAATEESKAWKAAMLQVVREGTAAEIAAHLTDLEAQGDITRLPEESPLDVEAMENGEAIDAEIALDDADQSLLEDVDRTPDGFIAVPRHPGQTFFGDDDSPEQFLDTELRVENGRCWLQRPYWMCYEALTKTGEEVLDEIGTRFGVLDAVGKWLELNRKDFLNKPEPVALGVLALEEMNRGLPSVSPSMFLRLSGIEARITRLAGVDAKKATDIEGLFSRYTTGCHLVWNTGSLPLDFIFSIEARKAWVASAVLQECEHSKTPLTRARLDKYRHVTVPNNSEAKEALNSMNVSSLSFPDFIRRANCLAETKWTDVVRSYLYNYL